MSRKDDLERARAEAALLSALDFEPAEGWRCDSRREGCTEQAIWRIVHLCCGFNYPACEEHRGTVLHEATDTTSRCLHCGSSSIYDVKPLPRKAK